MRRREILTASGVCMSASFGGCLSGSEGGENPLARIEIVDTDEPPELPVVPTVSVVNEDATEARPASIAVSWKNEGTESIHVAEKRSIVFRTARSADETAHLLGGDREDAVSFDGCWYLSGEVGGDAAYRNVELDSGDAHEGESNLYAATAECLTTGEYRFQTDVTIWQSDESEEEGRSEEWGFVLDIRTDS